MKPHNDVKAALRLFGFDSLRNEQIKPIEALRKGKSVFVNAPTSAGKSLIYQLPAVLHRNRLTIVIEPTISLMLDQVQKLNRFGLCAAHLDSSLTKAQRQELMKRLDGLTFLYTTPEQLIRPAILKKLKRIDVYQLVIDEAHCILDWGYSFRGAYLELGGVIREIEPQCVSAFTATASPEDEGEIQHLLGVEMKVFRCKSDRKNLIYSKKHTDSRREKLRFVRKYLKKYEPRKTVIYCNTHRAVESVAAELEKKYPDRVGAYHSGLSSGEKNRQQIRFCSGEYTIMVATSAFGMGIDLPDIELVLHFNMPFSMNDYIQQTGRAGRDGGKAHCVLLYSDEDFWTAAALVEPCGNARLNESLRRMMDFCNDRAHCLKRLMAESLGQENGKSCRFCTNCQAGRR